LQRRGNRTLGCKVKRSLMPRVVGQDRHQDLHRSWGPSECRTAADACATHRRPCTNLNHHQEVQGHAGPDGHRSQSSSVCRRDLECFMPGRSPRHPSPREHSTIRSCTSSSPKQTRSPSGHDPCRRSTPSVGPPRILPATRRICARTRLPMRAPIPKMPDRTASLDLRPRPTGQCRRVAGTTRPGPVAPGSRVRRQRRGTPGRAGIPDRIDPTAHSATVGLGQRPHVPIPSRTCEVVEVFVWVERFPVESTVPYQVRPCQHVLHIAHRMGYLRRF
jgi:hypothetical protein